jgi:hypothetical protein
MITTKAVMDTLPENTGTGPLARAVLARFRRDFHACLTARADELADAVLCADGPVRNLAALSLAAGIGAATAHCMTRSVTGGSRSPGCGGAWPACRYRGRRTGG